YRGQDILKLSKKEMGQYRGKEAAIIFQDALAALNPTMRVGKQIMENILQHNKSMNKSEAFEEAVKMLDMVGIPDARQRAKQYPHEFSGGMRQRAMIAIAFACQPKLLIADEPTTALDVTIQAQILELMKHIQKKYGTAIIIITHDLGVVAQLADRVLVMYSGRIVEEGSTADIFYRTAMPYTWFLLRSLPRLDTGIQQRLKSIQGQPPNLVSPPKGCNFNPRCPFVTDECLEVDPFLVERGDGHRAACVLSKREFEERKHEKQDAEREGVEQ